ncbi:MAG: DUF839 domain-containing protein, partial [Winogradskyella sp.]|nr:DUF839 domain-containing protein [Winogradskyella sp.]
MSGTPKLNIFFLLFPCLFFAQSNISDFTSIRKDDMTYEMKIPNTHKFQIIIEEGDLRDDSTPIPEKFDFTAYVPIGGSSENGYLSINSERDPGDVSILDINFNTTTKLWSYTAAANLDFSAVSGTQYNCSGTVTPWNTVITCEERTAPDGPDADSRKDIGWCIEIDPVTKTVGTSDNPQKLWALGNMRHENVVIDPSTYANNRVIYFGEDINNGYIYKLVADTPKDFTNGYNPTTMNGGKLFVYRGPKNGAGQWVQLNNFTDIDQNTTRTQSDSAGGATFNGGVEDVEINPIDNNIYFAVKGLGESCIYKIVDPDPLSGSSIPVMSKYAGGASKQYEVLPGVFEAWGDGVDNLAFDDLGNLWSMQDDLSNTEGFIWVIENGHVDGSNEKAKIFGQVPIGAEPTGITFSPDYRFMFMSIMHPNTSNNGTQKDAAGTTLANNKDAAIVISRIEELGTTYVYDNGWVSGTPAGTSPTYSDIVIKNGDAEITQTMTCYKVIVKPGASLKVNSGITLTVEDELTLESSSNSYSSLLGDGAIIGTIKYERFVNAQTNRNDLIAPPLDGQTWSDFLTTDSDKNNPNERNIFNNGAGTPTY